MIGPRVRLSAKGPLLGSLESDIHDGAIIEIEPSARVSILDVGIIVAAMSRARMNEGSINLVDVGAVSGNQFCSSLVQC